MIKYGIGFSYLPDWGVKEALREIYQNFKDFGEYSEETRDCIGEDGTANTLVTLRNSFIPEDLTFLQIGKSGKRNDSSKIGEHGEGLKMAMLVLTRMKHAVNIYTPEYILCGDKYDDPDLGECFGISKAKDPSTESHGLKMQFTVPKKDYDLYHKCDLKDEDVIFRDSYHGAIVAKNKGDIYVGGIFVCNLPGYKHAFDFPPDKIQLDRDRKVPGSWDVKYHANNIISAWGGIKRVDQLQSTECSEIKSIPKTVAEKFKPVKVGKEIKLAAGKVIANREQERVLLGNKVVANRWARFKAKISKKRTPTSILNEFWDTHSRSMSTKMKADLKEIIKASKNW